MAVAGSVFIRPQSSLTLQFQNGKFMFHANLILEWIRNHPAPHSLHCRVSVSVRVSHLIDDVEDGAYEEGDDGEEDPDDEAGVGGAVTGLRGLRLDRPVENCSRLLRPRLLGSL